MMDEVAAIFEKYGYKSLGLQQSLLDDEVLRFIQGRTLIDVVTYLEMDDETYELVMQSEEE
jgi:hypothetical protein